MKKKLQNSQGETLVEVLASILICSLSIALLFGAVMASTNIDRTAQKADKEYYEALTKAERQGSADAYTPPADAKMAITPPDPAAPGLSVQFFGTKDLLSYAIGGTGT